MGGFKRYLKNAKIIRFTDLFFNYSYSKNNPYTMVFILTARKTLSFRSQDVSA
ncbi:hypothetical protein UBN67_04070 [Helicobacter pylori]